MLTIKYNTKLSWNEVLTSKQISSSIKSVHNALYAMNFYKNDLLFYFSEDRLTTFQPSIDKEHSLLFINPFTNPIINEHVKC